jgi:putative nucleotidyltransferase with HDIG domain
MAVRVVSTRRAIRSPERWLPHAFVATGFVVVVPAVLVSLLVPPSTVLMLVLSLLTGIVLSLLAASIGEAVWKRLPSSQDLVFADLMLWGWLRRSVAERRLAQAEKLLGAEPHGASLDALTKLVGLLEARDARTYGHSQRVTRHAERIATTMGLPADEVAQIRTAAALHDVGKLHTPRRILTKPGRLTDSEFALVKRHPVDGAAMASGIGDAEIAAMIRHHHERLDGRGYPDGLAGDAIPLGARIIAVADTFDAITSNRTYRRASHHKRALDVLATESGKQLDGDAVAAFRGYYRGQRTVALSALIAALPQRLLSWLGGASPAIGAGAATATSLLIGLGAPDPPADTAIGTPAPMVASAPKRASVVAAEAARARSAPAASKRRSGSPRRSGDGPRARTRPPGGTAPGTNTPAGNGGGGSTPVAGGGQPGGSGSGGGGRPNEQPPESRPIVEVPGVRTPEVKVPGVTVPEVKVPQVPGVDLPEIKTPELRTPEITTPEVKVPGAELPGLKLP